MEDLSLHMLDIAENSIRAGARLVELRVREDDSSGLLEIEISDDGCGMDEQARRAALSPFSTSRTERDIGLGLPLLAQAARATGGDFEIRSEPGHGTRVRATFMADHIDCKPWGDLLGSFRTLAVGNPQVRFVLEVIGRDGVERLDSRQLRDTTETKPGRAAPKHVAAPANRLTQDPDSNCAEHDDVDSR